MYINNKGRRQILKRRDLEKLFRQNGWWPYAEGKHTKWTDGKNIEEIPKHKEINERLAKSMIKRWGLKK